MPDQIERAKARNVNDAHFELMQADQISTIEKQVDDIIDFRILHHIPEWKTVIAECYKKLSAGGVIYIIERYRVLSKLADTFLEWQHPEEALITVAEFETEMKRHGFVTNKKSIG